MKYYVVDTESTTKEDDCRVWAYAICDVFDFNNIIVGTSIDELMLWCSLQADNPKIYLHNMKWDSQFIIYWLFKNGFTHVQDRRNRATKTFTTLISDKGLYYSIEVIFKLQGKKVRKVTFYDSYKLIPLSVEGIAAAFHLPFKKLEIDYSAHDDLPEGSPLSPKEDKYIRHDVLIVAYGIRFFLELGLDKMTIGSCALNEYKTIIGKKQFDLLFPPSEHGEDIRQSYRGGFTYLEPQFAGKVLQNGIVLDVNSLYPDRMRYCLLPYGNPIFYRGEYKPDEIYTLYVQMIRCQFKLKPGKIPTIQIKNSMFFTGNEYLTTSGDEEITLVLTSVDLEMFLDHYEVYNIEYVAGWKFKGAYGLFDEYVDKWISSKEQASIEENWGMYLISKLFLNSLYGKFGTSTIIKSKVPYLDKNDVVHYYDSEPEQKEGVYIAMASFITSYARQKTIQSAQKIKDDYNAGRSNIQFVYADTDSLHCISPDFSLPEDLEIHPTKLGAWKYEGKWKRAKFLRQKCYIEEFTKHTDALDPEYKLKVTVAGMPDSCYDQVDFRNFKIGASYKGKKQPQIVKGGVILRSIDFTIKP